MKMYLSVATIFLLFAGCSALSLPKENYAEVLIRHELSSPYSYMRGARALPYYVTVDGKDLSAAQISRLSNTGTSFYPGSALSKSMLPGHYMRLVIGPLSSRPDGDFDVRHSYDCGGGTCGSWHRAVMHRDRAGWHVVSSLMESISRSETPNNSFKPNPLRGFKTPSGLMVGSA
jgi:hypothetical protein